MAAGHPDNYSAIRDIYIRPSGDACRSLFHFPPAALWSTTADGGRRNTARRSNVSPPPPPLSSLPPPFLLVSPSFFNPSSFSPPSFSARTGSIPGKCLASGRKSFISFIVYPEFFFFRRGRGEGEGEVERSFLRSGVRLIREIVFGIKVIYCVEVWKVWNLKRWMTRVEEGEGGGGSMGRELLKVERNGRVIGEFDWSSGGGYKKWKI